MSDLIGDRGMAVFAPAEDNTRDIDLAQTYEPAGPPPPLSVREADIAWMRRKLDSQWGATLGELASGVLARWERRWEGEREPTPAEEEVFRAHFLSIAKARNRRSQETGHGPLDVRKLIDAEMSKWRKVVKFPVAREPAFFDALRREHPARLAKATDLVAAWVSKNFGATIERDGMGKIVAWGSLTVDAKEHLKARPGGLVERFPSSAKDAKR